MKVCAVCCTYNRVHLLPYLLWCFEQQTHEDRNLLIYDDHEQIKPQLGGPWSPDGPAHGAWSVVSSGTPHESLGAKRNHAIMIAEELFRPDVFAVWDDDDYYAPNALAQVAKACERELWCRASVVWCDQGGVLVPSRTHGRPDKRDMAYQGAWGFRREVFFEQELWWPDNRSYVEDRHFANTLLAAGIRSADSTPDGLDAYYVYDPYQTSNRLSRIGGESAYGNGEQKVAANADKPLKAAFPSPRYTWPIHADAIMPRPWGPNDDWLADTEIAAATAESEPVAEVLPTVMGYKGPVVRLCRAVDAPGSSGPTNGQYALQRLLAASGAPWLKIGGTPQNGDIPWFWSCEDGDLAARWAATGMPFVIGPNVLFNDARNPGGQPYERVLCHSRSCKMIVTESAWYAELIAGALSSHCRPTILTVPYPIDPMPDGPLDPEIDVLVYAKSGYGPHYLSELGRMPNSALLVYGWHTRDMLVNLARRSRCCLYISDNDRGPLGLAEIILSGCPAIGVPRGAPWIDHGVTGYLQQQDNKAPLPEQIAFCHALDRGGVAKAARAMFDPVAITQAVVSALDDVRRDVLAKRQEAAA